MNSDVIMVLDHGRIIERGSHDQLIAEKGLGDKVLLAGFRHPILPYVAGADFGVLASTVREGCPLSPQEYMSQGRPVVATNNGGQREYIDDGKNGLLVEPGDARQLADAMRRLAADAELRRRLGRQAKADYDAYEWIRASASMPLASKVVELDGHKLLDGGVSDSIPLAYAESIGYERNLVILTQPEGYVKKHTKLMPLMRIGLRRYPRMIEAMDKRYLMYNEQLAFVRQAEQEGRCMVIRPDERIPIGHVSHDPEQMKLVYRMGRDMGERKIEEIKAFYK